jgi:uncharacterized protein (TIGR02145 family)
LSTADQPGHGKFIIDVALYNNYQFYNFDWRTNKNSNLWQGLNGINNPCPNGFRLPTNSELEIERISWNSSGITGAYSSSNKWTLTEKRDLYGEYWNDYIAAKYWSSDQHNSGNALAIYRYGEEAWIDSEVLNTGQSVRCIKDYPASIGSIDTVGSINNGNLYSTNVSTNVSSILNYKNGNGAFCDTLTFQSSGVTGLTAKLSAGYLNNGDGTLTFSISGTPNTSGTAIFNISIGGKNCVFTRVVNLPIGTFKTGTTFCNGNPTNVIDVTNPITGKTWMDRNLGASRAAFNITDPNAYGDLYQWGRSADGHQCRSSNTTNVLSTTDVPDNSNFIIIQQTSSSNFDWRITSNNQLWSFQGSTNNPCPIGYRIPYLGEFIEERNSWQGTSYNSPYNSILKLPISGYRDYYSGQINNLNSFGGYWTSNTSQNWAGYFEFNNNSSGSVNYSAKAHGMSVRCIKD